MQAEKEGVARAVGDDKNISFRLCALDFVILDDEFLLQNFDGIELLSRFCLCKHNLSEVAFTQNSQKIEVVESNPFP